MKQILLLVTVVLLVALTMINDPPDNLTVGVDCQVVSFQPAREVPVKAGDFVGRREVDATATVRLSDGVERGTKYGPIGACRIGQPAKATVRVGRLTGRLISVVWVSCL